MLNNKLVGFLIKWVLPIENLLKYTFEKSGINSIVWDSIVNDNKKFFVVN